MACPGCNLNGISMNYVAVSYTPTLNSHSPNSVAYSHNTTYTAVPDLAGINALNPGLVTYSNANANGGYTNQQFQLNYQISEILKDVKSQKTETENLPVLVNEEDALVPIKKSELVDTNYFERNSRSEQEIVEALNRILNQQNNGGNALPGTLRLTEIEEVTVTIQKRRLRTIEVVPERKEMENVTESTLIENDFTENEY